MRRCLTMFLVVLFAALPTSAAELAGVSMPDTVNVAGKQLTLNGMGLREKLMFDIYVAGLYLETKSSDAETILASPGAKFLRMHFVYKKVGEKKLTDAWTEGLENNVGSQLDALRPSLDRLNSWMEEMVRGDEMTFTSIPGQGLRVEVKGQEKGVIDDEAFSKAFWSIFLGEDPPTGKLKKGLLGAD